MRNINILPRKIIHFVSDEKFIDMAFREFEAVAPGVNKLVILGKRKTLRFVKNKTVEFYSGQQAINVIQSDECAAVICHSLDDRLLRLLKNIPNNKRVIWLGWGWDYYGRLLSGAYPDGLLLSETKAIWLEVSKPSTATALAAVCKSILKLVLGRSMRNHQALLSRIDYFSPVIDTEHQLACQLNPWFKPQYLTWNYGTVEDDLETAKSVNKPLGGNILIGNSATAENNHFEVFELLKHNVDYGNRKIIVPLSYGDVRYKEKIISYGQQKFGKQFVPLTNFMSKDEYLELLQSCGHVFMNHLRQQALGNICIMMLKGAKIYMNPRNPLHAWMAVRGAVIESIDNILKMESSERRELLPLTDEQKLSNLIVVKEHWGRDVQRKRTRKLTDAALGIRES